MANESIESEVKIEDWGDNLPTFVTEQKSGHDLSLQDEPMERMGILGGLDDDDDDEEGDDVKPKKIRLRKGQPGYVSYKKRKRIVHRLPHDSRNCTICDQFINAKGLLRLTKAMYERWGMLLGLKEFDRICFNHMDHSDVTVVLYMPRLKKGGVPTINLTPEVEAMLVGLDKHEDRKARILELNAEKMEQVQAISAFPDQIHHKIIAEDDEESETAKNASKEDLRKVINTMKKMNNQLEGKLVMAMNKYNYVSDHLETTRMQLKRAKLLTKRRRETLPKRKIPAVVENFLMKEKKWPKGMASYLASYETPGRFPSCKDSISLALYLRNAMGPQAYRVLKDASLLPLPSQSVLKQLNKSNRQAAEPEPEPERVPEPQPTEQRLVYIQSGEHGGDQIFYEVIETTDHYEQ